MIDWQASFLPSSEKHSKPECEAQAEKLIIVSGVVFKHVREVNFGIHEKRFQPETGHQSKIVFPQAEVFAARPHDVERFADVLDILRIARPQTGKRPGLQLEFFGHHEFHEQRKFDVPHQNLIQLRLLNFSFLLKNRFAGGRVQREGRGLVEGHPVENDAKFQVDFRGAKLVFQAPHFGKIEFAAAATKIEIRGGVAFAEPESEQQRDARMATFFKIKIGFF